MLRSVEPIHETRLDIIHASVFSSTFRMIFPFQVALIYQYCVPGQVSIALAYCTTSTGVPGTPSPQFPSIFYFTIIPMPKRRRNKGAQRSKLSWLSWLEDPVKVMDWMDKYNLDTMLDKSQGIVKISNFFPTSVAEGILHSVETTKEWNVTESPRDLTKNNISHKFWSSKTAANLSNIFRAIGILQPGHLSTFSAGKYERSNHIEPHDDRAYTNVMLEDGAQIRCSRDIAVIYYLTKDWKESDGGTLVDIPTGTRYVPEFNSLVAFRIPRFHEVTAVTADRARYSIFGWFLTEGILYDLFKCDESVSEDDESGEGSDVGSGGGGGIMHEVENQAKKRRQSDDGGNEGDSRKEQRRE